MMGKFGNILRINLTEGTVKREELSDEMVRKFLGGRGLGTKILYDETKAGIDPLGPENKLIFAV